MTFITSRVIFWFLPNLQLLNKITKILRLRRFGRNRNITRAAINVLSSIETYFGTVFFRQCMCV